MGHCVESQTVLPALETFEERLDLPTIYYSFYDSFVRASAGENKWRSAAADSNAKEKRLATIIEEAFAWLLFRNNYFTWLFEAKLHWKDKLKTDYDPESQRAGCEELSKTCALSGAQIDLNEDGGGSAETVLIIDRESERFKMLRTQEEKKLKQMRKNARTNATYKNVANKVKEMLKREEQASMDNDNSSPSVYSETEQERKKKRRKLLNTFKEYTVRQGNEGRFKGWSRRAAMDMTELVRAIKSERERYNLFNRAYREVYYNRFKHKIDNIVSLQEEEFEPDYSTLWELDNIDNQAEV